MLERINILLQEVEEFKAQSKEQIDEYRIKWLSKKGEITSLFDDFKLVAPEIKREVGQKLNELKKEYPSASILKDNRIVFNIKGNNYRLIVAIHYTSKIIFIRFVGTHAEYDKINALTI